IIVRGDDAKVRAFYNICPHRGNTILYDPAGNAKRMTCIFHAWSFDSRGECVDISREEQGYQERFCKKDASLREVKCDLGFGGFVHNCNRIPGMMQPGYFERKYTAFSNGHASVGSMSIQYDKYAGSKERAVGWPGLAPGGWYMVDLFPGMTYNLRTSVLRIDTV